MPGWRWQQHPAGTAEHALTNGQYTTKYYLVLDERPFAEARRWLKSLPKPKAPQIASADEATAALVVAGYTVATDDDEMPIWDIRHTAWADELHCVGLLDYLATAQAVLAAPAGTLPAAIVAQLDTPPPADDTGLLGELLGTTPQASAAAPTLPADVAEQLAALGMIVTWHPADDEAAGWAMMWPGESEVYRERFDAGEIRDWLREEELWQEQPIRTLLDAWQWEHGSPNDGKRRLVSGDEATGWYHAHAQAAYEALARMADWVPFTPEATTPARPPHAITSEPEITFTEEQLTRIADAMTGDDAPLPPRGTSDACGVYDRATYEEYETVAPNKIVASRFQPRTTFDDAALAELAENIGIHGVQTPLLVFVNDDGDLELIAGERRWRAAQIAGVAHLPVRILEGTLATFHELAVFDNLQRENLSPVEEGKAFERMASELGYSESEISRRVGKARAYVQQRRALAKATPALAEAVTSGALTFSQARGLIDGSGGDETAQARALKTVLHQVTSGVRMPEAEAKRTAEVELFTHLKASLTALGWITSGMNGGLVVWGGSEKPAPWTAAVLAAAVREGRRPQGEPPAPVLLSRIQHGILQCHGYFVRETMQPWTVLSRDNELVALGPDEVIPFLAALDAEWAAIQARYTAKGWTITHNGGNQFKATSSQGHTDYPWALKGVLGLLAMIEAGTVSPHQAASPTVRTSGATVICARCQTKTPDDYNKRRYIQGHYYCLPCADLIQAEEQVIVTRRREALTSRHGAAISQIPRALRELILFKCISYQQHAYIDATDRLDDEVGALATLDDATLTRALGWVLVDAITDDAGGNHWAPALLGEVLPGGTEEEEDEEDEDSVTDDDE